MDKQERKFRIEQLKRKIKKEVHTNTLFDECIDALGDNTRIYSLDESVRVVAMLVMSFPFTKWGRIDWESVERKITIHDIDEIIKLNEFENENELLIIWDEMNLPVVESTLQKILSNIDDVDAVGFDTWIVNMEMNKIIEIHHEGEITIGIHNRE
ncbi:hypothetical protein HQN89_34980 [Paenibacillus frigoriresistens]|uniref:CDI toxin immunity protein n=1 Tax=Paenibacillus alginolyticus TaxID=59839 RepID=UPI0015639869|nr:hypothetical protein [Paenibacillus frigoriresistens]NRF96010.1 hypothetical protein [Paenibacillus frigoriresistens]